MAMITLERLDLGVVLLGLERPEKHNALSQELVEELHDVLTELEHEQSVLVLHSTTPGVFVAGADIAQLLQRDEEAALRGLNSRLFARLEAHRWPTIAVVDGPALGGGCELALACDLRIATARARFAQPELGLGIMAGAGANWRLPAAVGLPLAREMLYTGRALSAAEALERGLVTQVVDPDVVLDRALAMAESIASRPWRALELTKLALRHHAQSTTTFDLVAQALLFESDEKRDRMTRFLER
jgi:enoyl-CoA hydratase